MHGYKTIHDMVCGIIENDNITVPVVLHLDHGSLEGCIKALAGGFSSVMYDGSKKPFDINLAESNDICGLAATKGASVEVECGGVGGSEDGVVSSGEKADLTECMQMSGLPVACLAASVGSIHGVYPKD